MTTLIYQQLVLLGHVGARGRGRDVSEMPRIGLMIGHWKADRTETGACWWVWAAQDANQKCQYMGPEKQQTSGL